MAGSLAGVLSEMCSAPLEAAVQAEEDYRAIWVKWLKEKLEWADNLPPAAKATIDWTTLFQTAPIVDVNQTIQLAITLRVASVKEKKGGLSGGISVGPIHLSGNFGFSSSSSQESLIQASTAVTLTNVTTDLTGLLAVNNLVPSSPDDLKTAISLLTKKDAPEGAAGANS